MRNHLLGIFLLSEFNILGRNKSAVRKVAYNIKSESYEIYPDDILVYLSTNKTRLQLKNVDSAKYSCFVYFLRRVN